MMKSLTEELISREIRAQGKGATVESVQNALAEQVSLAVKNMFDRKKLVVIDGHIDKASRMAIPVLRGETGRPWFGFTGSRKEDFLMVKASQYPFSFRSFPVGGNWRASVLSLAARKKLVLCRPPKLFGSKGEDYYCRAGCEDKLEGSLFDYIDGKIAEAFLQEDAVSAVQLTGGRISFGRIGSRFKAFEKEGLIEQVYCTHLHKGNFRPRWFRATQKLKDLVSNHAKDEPEALDFEGF